MTQQERDAIFDTNAEITLDGKPAMLAGRLNDYVTVHTLPRYAPTGKAVEFAWGTAKRVLANGGAFKS